MTRIIKDLIRGVGSVFIEMPTLEPPKRGGFKEDRRKLSGDFARTGRSLRKGIRTVE